MFSLLKFYFDCQYWCPPAQPSTFSVVEDKSLKTQYQVSYVQVEAMEVDPAAIKENP